MAGALVYWTPWPRLAKGRTEGEAMQRISSELMAACKAKLLATKQDLLNRARSSKREFELRDGRGALGGDEADQTMMIVAENEFRSGQRRIKEQLLEIELALARIERGAFGTCEETEETIEPERLMALPWTRVSIEGAELREAMQKRYAF